MPALLGLIGVCVLNLFIICGWGKCKDTELELENRLRLRADYIRRKDLYRLGIDAYVESFRDFIKKGKYCYGTVDTGKILMRFDALSGTGEELRAAVDEWAVNNGLPHFRDRYDTFWWTDDCCNWYSVCCRVDENRVATVTKAVPIK